ncbi:MAG: hypothetical protein K0U38_00440 [Epsilonproteobacteria bacterium]|nr:hypothetical protein [Campylobacterota bacterium]
MVRYVVFIFIFLMLGCSSKYKQENYQKLQQDEVKTEIKENKQTFEHYRQWYINENNANEKEIESVEEFSIQ